MPQIGGFALKWKADLNCKSLENLSIVNSLDN